MRASLDGYVTRAATDGRLVVQPRMGFGQIAAMRVGLEAVRDCRSEPRVATVTVDAYTRVGEPERAAEALATGQDLNGFPLTIWGADATRSVVDGIQSAGCPVQVRHGAALPGPILDAAAGAGIDAVEGGPVSYCLPYSRAPLRVATAAWAAAARFWAKHGDSTGIPAHLESFGGCLYGQLCPPGLLVAVTILEALFFASHGITSLSVSLAQGGCDDQDVGALLALDRIRRRRLSGLSTHVVAYTFMGLFPQSPAGAERLIRASARTAVTGGAARLLVKTAAEAHGIPTVEDNLAALAWAREEADRTSAAPCSATLDWANAVEREAETLIEAVLRLSPDPGRALVEAFGTGLLDVPWALHPCNRGETRSALDPHTGATVWTDAGRMPVRVARHAAPIVGAAGLRAALSHVRRRYDGEPDADALAA